MRRHWRWLLVGGYFLLAIACNAWMLGAGVGMQQIDTRAHDFGWELGLPWQAAQGKWVGRDFHYPMGPAWQLLGSVGVGLSRAYDPGLALFGLHVVFPVVSLALCAWLAHRCLHTRASRLAGFVGLALLALHDDVRTLRAWISLAIVLVFVTLPPRDQGRGRRAAAFLVVVGTLVSFETGLLGLVSLGAVTVLDAAHFDGRVAWRRFAKTLAWILGALGVFAMLWAALGGSLLAALLGWLEVTRAYAVTMVEGRHGLRLNPIWLFLGLCLLLFGWCVRSKDREGSLWLAGVVPLCLRSLIRSDAEHVYSALAPLVGVVWLIAVRSLGASRWRAGFAGLVASCFSIAWFGTHIATPTAWKPAAIFQVARGRELSPMASVENDLSRTVLYARAQRGSGCIVLPERLVVAHPLAGVPGPTESVLRWTPRMKRELSDRIRAARCKRAVRQVVSFDLPAPYQSIAFGEDFLLLSELYETTKRIGPATFAATLRAEPMTIEKRALPSVAVDHKQVSVPGKLELDFGGESLPADAVVRFRYRLDVPTVRWLLGGAPALRLQFFRGDSAVGPAMVMPDVDVGRNITAVVPVVAEIAEWRWVAGTAPSSVPSATRLVLELEPRRFSGPHATLRLDDFEVLFAPPLQASAAPECASRLSLLSPAVLRSAMARGTAVHVEGDALELPPNAAGEPLAEVFFPLRPCPNSCLFAELALAKSSNDGARFEVHVIDGSERPLLVNWSLSPGERRLARVPLGPFAGRDVMLRFGTWANQDPSGDRARFISPRVGPCSPLPSLIQSVNFGRSQHIRGKSWVDFDKLVLEAAPHGEPPTELRIPVRYPRGTCLAFELFAEGAAEVSPIAVDIGFLHGRHVVRLAREVLHGGEKPWTFRDIVLDEYAGRAVAIRVAAWSVDGSSPLLGVVKRPRLYRCGQEPRFEY